MAIIVFIKPPVRTVLYRQAVDFYSGQYPKEWLFEACQNLIWVQMALAAASCHREALQKPPLPGTGLNGHAGSEHF